MGNKIFCFEFGVASNTNFRGTQQFVLGGITSVEQCLKLHNMLPPNGIILGSSSTIVTDDGKEKKVCFIQLTIEVVEVPMLCSYGAFKTWQVLDLLVDNEKFV